LTNIEELHRSTGCHLKSTDWNATRLWNKCSLKRNFSIFFGAI
jgi:hypothetical protein